MMIKIVFFFVLFLMPIYAFSGDQDIPEFNSKGSIHSTGKTDPYLEYYLRHNETEKGEQNQSYELPRVDTNMSTVEDVNPYVKKNQSVEPNQSQETTPSIYKDRDKKAKFDKRLDKIFEW